MKARALAALLLAGSQKTLAADAETPPHIAFVLVDDLGFNDAWANSTDLGGAWPRTAALAAEGVALAEYYTTPLCTPTRGALMTGRLPQRLGLHHAVITGFQDYGLPVNETTLADKVSAVGYAAHHVGKWHLGNSDDAYAPTRRGFRSSYGYQNGEEDHRTRLLDGLADFQESDAEGARYYSRDDLAAMNGTHSAFLFVERARLVIADHDATVPLFLCLSSAFKERTLPSALARGKRTFGPE